MDYTAVDIGNYIISRCDICNCPVNEIELQALLYIVQAKYQIIKEECEAKADGPIFPYAAGYYSSFKEPRLTRAIIGCPLIILKEEDKEKIRKVIDEYLPTIRNTSFRRNLICASGTAWWDTMGTRTTNRINLGQIIKCGLNPNTELLPNMFSENEENLKEDIRQYNEITFQPSVHKISSNSILVVTPFLDDNLEPICINITKADEGLVIKQLDDSFEFEKEEDEVL